MLSLKRNFMHVAIVSLFDGARSPELTPGVVFVHLQGLQDTLPAVRLQPSLAAALDQRQENLCKEHRVLLPTVSTGSVSYLHQAGALYMRYGDTHAHVKI